MAQNITIAGATYSDVPGVEIPKSGGGTAYFPDTSGDTVTPASLLQGYTAHDASGQPITGEAVPGGGGGSASLKVVNFFDYDGTVLYSYTAAEFAALSAMPSNPVHAGLTSQGWNHTLSAAKSYVAAYGYLDIGQMYTTSDGKTRLYIRIAAPGRMTVPLCYSQTVSNGVTIGWGDGSATVTLSGTGYKNTSHTYSSVGDYVITLAPSSGCGLSLGAGSSDYCVLGATGNSGYVYNTMLKKAEIGSGVTALGTYAFRDCRALESITLPSGITSISDYSLYNCYSLKCVAFPSGVTAVGQNALYYCYTLDRVSLPQSVTALGSNAFYANNCLATTAIPSGLTTLSTGQFRNSNSISSMTVPSSVTSIGASVFYACYGLAEVHIKRSAPPTLSSSAFTNLPADCTVYVPSASLNTYKSASNWSNFASQMAGE